MGRHRKPKEPLSVSKVRCYDIPEGTITITRPADGGVEYYCSFGCTTGKANSTECTRRDIRGKLIYSHCTARDQP